MSVEILDPGVLTLVQDRGRPWAAPLGVPRAGALDRGAAALALRLVGADPGAAVLESLLGGLTARALAPMWAAVAGAPAVVTVDGRPVDTGAAFQLPQGAVLRIAHPWAGTRTYLALGGGIEVPPVLGSRSTYTLAGLEIGRAHV